MEENRLYITEENKKDMITTSRWGKFLAILGYLFIGLMVLIGLVATIGGFFAQGMFGSAFPFPIWIFGLFYLLISALYFMPVHKMYLMCDHMRKSVDGNNQQNLNSAFSNLAKLYKYSGIMVIVMILLYFLLIISAVMYSYTLKDRFSTYNDQTNQIDTHDGIEEEELDTTSYELVDTTSVN